MHSCLLVLVCTSAHFFVCKGLPNIHGSTGPGSFIFRDQITGRSFIWKRLNIFKVFIYDVGSNASFIEAEGQNDQLDVKISPSFTILRVIITKN